MNHCIGIRREDKSIWERRVPLVPSDVRNLARDHGIPVVIQPSDIRAFDADEYDLAGATVSENLSDCSVVVAVKEIPTKLLRPGKTYVPCSRPFSIEGVLSSTTKRSRMIEEED